MVSMMAAFERLNAEGIRLASYAVGSHKATCPNCSHQRRKKADPCLSVTIEEGGGATWNCHHCGWAGGFRSGDYRPRHARKSYRLPAPVENPDRPAKLLQWFATRGISATTVERMGIYRTTHWFPQTGGDAPCIAFPYTVGGVLKNVKYRHPDKHFMQERDAEPVLYNADALEAETVVFVEGEMDVLACIEAGIANVVSLPNGAPAKEEQTDKRYEPLQTHAEALERVKRFIIATDMDGPGELLANELARRLGKDRCFRARFPDANDVQCKDANECLVEHGAEVLRECIEHAEPWPIEGLHTASDYADAVMSLYRGDGPKPLSTGFAEMDNAFRVLPGQFVVVTGIPNHGKSRWLDQVAVQMSRLHGWKWAVFSPETGNENHIVDLVEIWAGRPFFDGPTPRVSERELRDGLNWIEDRFFFIGTSDHTPNADWIIERARAAVIRHGIRGLIVDPYNEIEASRPAGMTETEFVSQLISKFKQFAKAHDVTVFMVVHPTKLKTETGASKEPVPGLYDLSGSAHWRNKADAGLVVYRDYEEKKTLVYSKKIRRQPICGQPGVVEFVFLPHDRRFTEISGSYNEMGRKDAA